MSNRFRKALTVLAVLSLLSGCASKKDARIPIHEDSERKELVQEEAKLPEACETIRAGKKEEEIIVKADALGNVKSVKANVTLSEADGSGYVRDLTRLANLRTEGGEEFFETGDGEILFAYEGKPIHYQGSSSEEVPVGVKLSYKLDGTPISPEALAGKSGHVEVRIDYENRTRKEVEIDGTEYLLPCPIMAVTLIPLSDQFHNIKAENGSIVSLSGTSAVIAFAVPGMKEALKLEGYEPTKETELPEYALIEADAENFALEFTATVFSSGFLKDMEEEIFDEEAEVREDVSSIKDASETLTEGRGELYEGMKEFEDYLHQYNDGLTKLSGGTLKLSEALNTLSGYSGEIGDGIDALNKGLSQLNTALSGIDPESLFP